MKNPPERNRAFASGARHANRGSQCRKRHAHIGWMCWRWQDWLVPRIACMRLSPSRAEQPLPGTRLLQGVAVS